MSGLWTYGRRPSCITRYRHGGYNAIYPLAAGEVFDGVAEVQRLERAEQEALQKAQLSASNQAASGHAATSQATKLRGEMFLASLAGGGGGAAHTRAESNIIAFPTPSSGQGAAQGTRRKSAKNNSATRGRQPGPPKPRD